MPEVILTDEQARIVTGTFDTVTVRDPSGRVLGHDRAEVDAGADRRTQAPGRFARTLVHGRDKFKRRLQGAPGGVGSDGRV